MKKKKSPKVSKSKLPKKKVNVKKGKSSKARGARFELKVRKDLESKGRVVDKWTNNVDLEGDKIVAAKKKFNPFSKAMLTYLWRHMGRDISLGISASGYQPLVILKCLAI